nr:hypothetical protein CFP56_43114 [Quercus suber]
MVVARKRYRNMGTKKDPHVVGLSKFSWGGSLHQGEANLEQRDAGSKDWKKAQELTLKGPKPVSYPPFNFGNEAIAHSAFEASGPGSSKRAGSKASSLVQKSSPLVRSSSISVKGKKVLARAKSSSTNVKSATTPQIEERTLRLGVEVIKTPVCDIVVI